MGNRDDVVGHHELANARNTGAKQAIVGSSIALSHVESVVIGKSAVPNNGSRSAFLGEANVPAAAFVAGANVAVLVKRAAGDFVIIVEITRAVELAAFLGIADTDDVLESFSVTIIRVLRIDTVTMRLVTIEEWAPAFKAVVVDQAPVNQCANRARAVADAAVEIVVDNTVHVFHPANRWAGGNVDATDVEVYGRVAFLREKCAGGKRCCYPLRTFEVIEAIFCVEVANFQILPAYIAATRRARQIDIAVERGSSAGQRADDDRISGRSVESWNKFCRHAMHAARAIDVAMIKIAAVEIRMLISPARQPNGITGVNAVRLLDGSEQIPRVFLRTIAGVGIQPIFGCYVPIRCQQTRSHL